MYKVKEVADILNLNERTVRNWINEGKIHAVKFGSEWRVSYEEVKRLKKEGV